MTARRRILVVDDEPQILRAVSVNLKALGHLVETASTGTEALSRAAARRPDAVILDLGLPDMEGVEVIAGLRGWTQIPIIILTVREGEEDKIRALDAGADDYLTKPFGMGELLARLRAALRRATPPDDERPIVETEHFAIDLAARIVRGAHGDEIRLTPTEWGIVEVLVTHRGKLVSQVHLLQEVWGPNYRAETNYLRVFMAQIRRKLEPTSGHPRYFVTEPGMGYRFDASGGSAAAGRP